MTINLGFGAVSKQKGVAMIEFAIAVPVLVFGLLVAADFGRLAYQWNTLTKAVQAASRYCGMSGHYSSATYSIDAATVSTAQSVFKQTAQSISTTLPNAKVEPKIINLRNYCFVQAEYNYKWMVPWVGRVLNGSSTRKIEASATNMLMRQ